MTMPHLMNCPHTEAGWCGECVIALWEEKEKYQALATQPQAPQGAVTGWQPIETAPKDWTDIQLWARGVWYPECSWGMQTYPGNDERVTWVYQDDYDCNGPVFTKVIDPSHWMPPPAAPETPEGKK